MSAIKVRLENAISSGEILEIKYFGGSIPGKLRNIVPVKIEGDKLIARCLKSNTVKTFSMNKISFSDENENYDVSSEVIELASLKSFKSIKELVAGYKSKLESIGWYVNLGNANSLSLHSYFKNGKPKKSSDICIYFDEYSEQMTYDIDKDDFITKRIKKQKPWCVMANNETTRYFTNLSHAIETFINFAKNLAQNKQ